jgi:hypothetical protein
LTKIARISMEIPRKKQKMPYPGAKMQKAVQDFEGEGCFSVVFFWDLW